MGGSVRDLLVGTRRDDFDLDLTTDARPDEIKSLLAGWADAMWTQGERFGTIGAKRGDRSIEITTFRAESYRDDSRKPHVTYADEDVMAAVKKALDKKARASFKDAKNLLVEAFERRYLGDLLEEAKGNISRAAQAAQMDRKHLRELMKKYGLWDGAGDEP